MDIQFIAGVATIIASMYGMLKFMLKDVHKEVERLNEQNKIFKEELLEFKLEMRNVNNRLDGLYRVILDRTYGKNIPEELR
jgi:hypothetical protein